MKLQSKDIALVDVNDLVPHPKNPHKHSDDQIERLCKLIEYQGFRNPIIVDNKSNYIVAGHGRLMAAKKLNMPKVPVTYQDFDNEDQLYAYIVSDNSIGKDTWADLDFSMINDQLGDLGPDFDVDLLGIKDFEIDVADKEGKTDEDAVPENVDTRCKPGDLWTLGEHRLLCGDATNIQHVEKLMDGKKADMVFTSPPYNGNTTTYDYKIVDGKKIRADKTLYKNNESDNKSSEDYLNFLNDVMGLCITFTKGFIFWNINYNAKSRFEYLSFAYNFKHLLHETIIWKKNALPVPSGFTRNYEFIFMFKTDDSLDHLNKEYDIVHNLWDVSNNNSQSKDHKACFPVGLPKKAIEISNKTKLIMDPFGGSGTTMIAAEKLNRSSYLLELDPSYCDVILKRWEDYSGQEATRKED